MRALLLLLAACASTSDLRKPFTIALAPSTLPTAAAPQASVAGVDVWANTTLWRNAPSDVEANVVLIGVDLHNTSAQPVAFDLNEWRLEDDHGRRAAPFLAPLLAMWPTDADTIRKGCRAHPPNTTSLEGGTSALTQETWRNGPSSGEWRDELGVALIPRDWLEQVRLVRVPRDVATRTLCDQAIAAGARLSGYLVFPRLADDAREATLIWRPRGGGEARIVFRARS